MDGGWTRTDSPFHPGEQAVQARLGVRDKVDAFARRVVRDHLPEQHRAFYAELPFVLLGTVDRQGRPWASLLAGRPGFVTSAAPRRLDIAARPLAGDPLLTNLIEDAPVGLLGIQLETRRRNRLTGRIADIGDGGFAIAIDQTFGNCPQYIQTRAVRLLPEIDGPAAPPAITHLDRFDPRARAMITSADTLFVATAHIGETGGAARRDPTLGADVSHRGGKPGFVRIEGDHSLVFPDYAGNNHFNTVGNILSNPKAGLLLVDFASGERVHVTGTAEIVWDGEEVRAFAGAKRLIRLRAEEVVRVAGGLPLRFDFGEPSPDLERTGSWTEAAEIIAAEKERNTLVPYDVVDVRPESATITSIRLRRADGKALAAHQPGQFLPIQVEIPGRDAPAMRTYTLSDAPDGAHYRLSIKREGGGALVSPFLHDHARPGFRLHAMAPRGRFVLDPSSERPVVLISAGVGITPMIAMANAMVEEAGRSGRSRRVRFIHGARDGRELAFGDHLRRLAAAHPWLSVHIRLSRPLPTDRLGVTHDSEGRIDLALLQDFLPLDDDDIFLCGPGSFMQAMHAGLTSLGVPEARIRYESFGPATVLAPAGAAAPVPSGQTASGPVGVRFVRAGIEAVWTPAEGTLLDLAEASGITPPYACRSGICGTCATRVTCGDVDYLEEPTAGRASDEALICCSTPRAASHTATCGGQIGVVLDL